MELASEKQKTFRYSRCCQSEIRYIARFPETLSCICENHFDDKSCLIGIKAVYDCKLDKMIPLDEIFKIS